MSVRLKCYYLKILTKKLLIKSQFVYKTAVVIKILKLKEPFLRYPLNGFVYYDLLCKKRRHVLVNLSVVTWFQFNFHL